MSTRAGFGAWRATFETGTDVKPSTKAPTLDQPVRKSTYLWLGCIQKQLLLVGVWAKATTLVRGVGKSHYRSIGSGYSSPGLFLGVGKDHYRIFNSGLRSPPLF